MDSEKEVFMERMKHVGDILWEGINPNNVFTTDGELKQWQRDILENIASKPMEERKELANDAVNHPSHYTDGKIEVIDFIEDKKLPFHLGNVVKYVSRAGKKDPAKTIEDLKKARWYLDRYIHMLELAAAGDTDGDEETIDLFEGDKRIGYLKPEDVCVSTEDVPPIRYPANHYDSVNGGNGK